MKTRLFRSFVAILLVLLAAGPAWPALAQSSVTVQLHDAKVQIIQGTPTFDVSLYFSLLDSAGNPVKDAVMGDFTLNEDSQEVQIASLDSAYNEPIRVAILLDTSASMTSDKMDAARKAASKFISDLQSGDQVAALSFDLTTVHQIDFTSDLKAAREVVELIQATPGAGTCMYDALYETVQMTAGQSSGRRAIVLLTDGVDEAGGKQPCSHYTVDDVVDLASEGKTRVPIYTIGLGNSVDTLSLDMLARETSGRSQYAPGPTQLDALFGRLTDELRSQYVLHYTSSATGGEHTLTLKASYHGAQNQASIQVEMPALPYSIAFTSPADAAEVTGTNTIAVSISGQGASIQKVQFLANGVSIGSDTESPYEMEWEASGLEAGSVFLEAIAQDAAGNELARSGVTVTYQPANAPTPTEGETGEPSTSSSAPTIILVAAASVVLLGVVIAILVIGGKRRRKDKERDKEWQETVQGVEELPTIHLDDRTVDSFLPSENALAVLVIQDCDDKSMVQQRIEITKAVTTLGRKADNDVIFAKDSPVSRHHAVVEERGGQMFLKEVVAVDEGDRPKPPTYGTFVNGIKVQDSVLLHDGDEIQLGKRVCIRFESVKQGADDDERTIDQSASSGDEKTVDYNTQ
jgi:Ca-activated chloride channel family protein